MGNQNTTREERPNPESFLRAAVSDGRGRLTIFFGYAAGVGKTYAMLDAAWEAVRNHTDVAAGYIEPHARPDTMRLLEGLEQIPALSIRYKGIELREFNLDAALKRRPELILVDELAHTNGEGCRHKKRYQDIKELLDAGIDVYTTVNVQHLESLHDIVAGITRISVHERIPDRIFDEADNVELIDIEPEELQKRLKLGKIYGQGQVDRAASNFFTRENLISLREIALRRLADRVNRIAIKEAETARGRVALAGERILVCVSPSPTSERVIRTAARMAAAFHGELSAVVVETPGLLKLQDRAKAGLEKNIRLAGQLGADVATLHGEDPAVTIAAYARENKVTKIVIGRTVHRTRLVPYRQGMIDRLITHVPTIDIYVIPDQNVRRQIVRKTASGRRRKASFRDWGIMGCALLAATCLAWGMTLWGLDVSNAMMAYMAAVLVTAYFTREKLPGAAASVISVLCFNFLFTDPKYSLKVSAPLSPATLAFMLGASFMISSLTSRLRFQARVAAEESNRLRLLLDIGNRMRKAGGTGEILLMAAEQAARLMKCPAVLYNMTDRKEQIPLLVPAGLHGEEAARLTNDNEKAVAAWVCKHCRQAGKTTDTLPNAAAVYLPVHVGETVFAVIGLGLAPDTSAMTEKDKGILYSILNETAIVISEFAERA